MNVTSVNYQTNQNSPNFCARMLITKKGSFFGEDLGYVIPKVFQNDNHSIVRILHPNQNIDSAPASDIINFNVNSTDEKKVMRLYKRVANAVNKARYTTGKRGVDLTDLNIW